MELTEIIQLFPPITVTALMILLNVARFENQRWIRFRATGKRGNKEYFGAFVDLTGFAITIYYYALISVIFYDHGALKTITLFTCAFVAPTITSLIIKDNAFIWFFCSVFAWALAIAVSFHVSWFGAF